MIFYYAATISSGKIFQYTIFYVVRKNLTNCIQKNAKGLLTIYPISSYNETIAINGGTPLNPNESGKKYINRRHFNEHRNETRMGRLYSRKMAD